MVPVTRVETQSSIAGASESTARMTLETTVHIEVLAKCEFAMKLTGTHLLHSDGTGKLITAQK